MSEKTQMSGQRFGRLTVIAAAPSKKGHAAWLCECECGATKIIDGGNLRSGVTQSCGCLKREALARTTEKNRKHRMCGTGTYKTWGGMKERCYNQKNTAYSRYGGRGIKVCERWLNSFETFLLDMGEKPPGMSLDRIDVNGDYKPSNCRWATMTTQNRNKRNNRIISFNGESRCLADWANQLNITNRALVKRLSKWSTEKALTTPKTK